MIRPLLSLLLIGLTANTSAEPLGRLFSSPSQRDTLDYVRKTKNEMVPAPISKAAVPKPKFTKLIPLPKTVAVQGFVKRSDGVTSTVWVNGKAMQEQSANQEIAVGRLPKYSNRVPVRVKATGKRLGLKAGQAYHPRTNKVKETSAH